MKIGIVGTGYVGLVAAACFAKLGHTVLAVDKDENKIDCLNNSKIPIFEAGLEPLIKELRRQQSLTFSHDLNDLSDGYEVIFIAVSTPSLDDGSANLDAVFSVAKSLAPIVGHQTVIVTKSTVPVGTGRKIDDILTRLAPEKNLTVASNPEFLREGSAIEDFMNADRIVIGIPEGENKTLTAAREKMGAIYAPLAQAGVPIFYTTRATAEIIKYAANAFLATKVAFINQIADLCEAAGADVTEVSKAVGLDQRIGTRFFRAGPGYGGSCFPKDTQAILKTGEELGVDLSIVKAVSASNGARKYSMADRIIKALDEDIDGKNVALLGLAFKPGTDDMRDAPSLDIISRLLSHGASIRAFDPESMEQCAKIFSNVDYAPSIDACISNADICVVVTEWPEFAQIDLAELERKMRGNVLVDLRNVFEPQNARNAGLRYSGIGR